MGNGFSCQNHILAIKIWLLAIILADISVILRDIQLSKYSNERKKQYKSSLLNHKEVKYRQTQVHGTVLYKK